MLSNDNSDYSSPNVGIVTADGTPMILSYNKKCAALDPVKQYGWSTEDNKPISNATAGCVAAVFEINGTKKPNKLSNDVVLFNANGLGNSCAIELDGGKCFTAPFTPTPVTLAECKQMKANGQVNDCYYNDDYWAGAVKQCGGKSNMPSQSDLAKIASGIYKGNPSISPSGTTNGLTYDENNTTGLPEPEFWMWSGDGSYGYVYNRSFGTDNTTNDYISRYTSGGLAVCLSD